MGIKIQEIIRRKKWLIAGVAAVLAAAVPAAVFFLSPRPSAADPRQYIRKALGNTVAAIRLEQMKQTALTDIFTLLAESAAKPSSLSFSAALRDAVNLGNPGIRMEVKTDPANRRSTASLALTMFGFPLGNLDLYLQDDLLSIAAPLFFYGEYGFHLSTLGRDFNASALSTLLETTLSEDLSVQIWPDSSVSAIGAPDWLAEANRDLMDKLTVSHLEDTEVRINDYLRTCGAYEASIPGEALQAYLRAVLGGIQDAPLFTGRAADLLSPFPQAIVPFDLDIDADAVTDFIGGDLTIFLFVHDDRLVRADFLLPVNAPHAREFHLSLQLGGEKNLLDAFSAKAGFAEEGFLLTWSGRHLPVNNRYDTSFFFYFYDDRHSEPVVWFGLDGWYDTASSEDNFALSAVLTPDDESGRLQVSLNGMLNHDKAGKTLKGSFDQIDLTGYGFQWQLTAGYEFRLLPSLEFPERDPDLLLMLPAEKLEALLEEIGSNAGRLLSLTGLF